VESIEPVWIFGINALVTGVLLGILIHRLFNPGSADVDKLKAELEQERAEMERYKASVNSHFDKTSELVNELTQDYVKVYRHLAEGAETLSDTREFSQVLEQSRGRVLITVDGESEEAGNVPEEVPAETAPVASSVDEVDAAQVPLDASEPGSSEDSADDESKSDPDAPKTASKAQGASIDTAEGEDRNALPDSAVSEASGDPARPEATSKAWNF